MKVAIREIAVEFEEDVEVEAMADSRGEDVMAVVVDTLDSTSPSVLVALVLIPDAIFGGPKNEVMLPFARGFFVVDAASSAALRLADMTGSDLISCEDCF